jgi:hypothetical protein
MASVRIRQRDHTPFFMDEPYDAAGEDCLKCT